jgi:MoxR-like ATPase
VKILENRNRAKTDDVVVNPALTKSSLTSIQQEIENIHVEEGVEVYIVELVRRTRDHKDVEVGSSPRGSLAVMKLAKARAFLNGRSFVIPDDVKAVAVPALGHRLVLKAEGWIRGRRPSSIVEDVLQSVPVPKVD